MRVLGLEAAIGSMLYPFLEAGHDVLASYDSRGIGNRKNFNRNFPEADYLDDPTDLLGYEDIDVIMCQPACGRYSNLSRKNYDECDMGIDLAYYIEKIRPRHFFIESKLDYLPEIPKVDGYSYQLEWVSNYHYGNAQRTRNRLWVMGTRDDVAWKFIPNEETHGNTVESILSKYPREDIPELDHLHVYKPFFLNAITREYQTLDDAFDMLLRDGRLTYTAADGQIKSRINRRIIGRDTCTSITSGGTWFHYDNKYPLTLREKAAIQGFPDEFSFKHMPVTRQDKAVGKSMPLDFTRELVRQLEGKQPSKRTKIVPNPPKLNLFRRINFGVK